MSKDSEAAVAIMQTLQMQAQMQSLLIDGYEWAFKACTREGSGPQLSQKEIRCVQAGMTNFIDARMHMAQALQGSAHAGH